MMRKALQRQQDKDKSKFSKVGKMAMTRSQKPALKQEQVKQKKRTEIEEDFINYGLGDFTEMAKGNDPKV